MKYKKQKMKKKIKKPNWIKTKIPVNSKNIVKIKKIIYKNKLNTVCEQASCPNLHKCFNNKTATFMILGNLCTRNCPFCDVSHGKPLQPNPSEPKKLAKTIKKMGLKYVVITSVNRDDLPDGGALQFVKSIKKIRKKNKNVKIEILVPDFRRCTKKALLILKKSLPNIFNHNIETVPRIYNKVRPGSNYFHSLKLLKDFKKLYPSIPTKSGIMLGLGETNKEIYDVMRDLINNGVTMLTIGQYLQPSKKHLSVKRYVSLQEFKEMKKKAIKIGFKSAFCGPFVRSSYLADQQAIKIIKT